MARQKIGKKTPVRFGPLETILEAYLDVGYPVNRPEKAGMIRSALAASLRANIGALTDQRREQLFKKCPIARDWFNNPPPEATPPGPGDRQLNRDFSGPTKHSTDTRAA